MAKVYCTPSHIQPPNISAYFGENNDYNAYSEACEKYRDSVVQWAKANTRSLSPLVGEIMHFPRGDGYASYVTFATSPLSMIHLEDGDAWHADAMTMRGLRVSDIKQARARRVSMEKLFKAKA